VNSFNFFKNAEFSPKKCNKSQNIPNMKTKIFSYPTIVLATYGKHQTQRSGVIFSLLAIKSLEKLSISILKKFFSKKLDQKKKEKGLMQMKMHSYSPYATGFCLLGHEDFLVLKINFLQISRVTKSTSPAIFFHGCDNMARITKGTKGCRGPLLVLPAFYNDIAMAGACMHVSLFQGEPLLMVKVLLS
jgi:hypothetical protein